MPIVAKKRQEASNTTAIGNCNKWVAPFEFPRIMKYSATMVFVLEHECQSYHAKTPSRKVLSANQRPVVISLCTHSMNQSHPTRCWSEGTPKLNEPTPTKQPSGNGPSGASVQHFVRPVLDRSLSKGNEIGSISF